MDGKDRDNSGKHIKKSKDHLAPRKLWSSRTTLPHNHTQRTSSLCLKRFARGSSIAATASWKNSFCTPIGDRGASMICVCATHISQPILMHYKMSPILCLLLYVCRVFLPLIFF